MPSTNTGNVLRFENGGIVLIGADDILNIKAGTLKYTIPGYEPIERKDRGIIQDPLAGDERESTVELSVDYTSVIDTDGLLTRLMGTLATNKVKNRQTDGKLFTFSLTVRIMDEPDGLPYDQYVFAKCYLADGFDYSASSGAEVDTLTIKCRNAEMSPTITRVAT